MDAEAKLTTADRTSVWLDKRLVKQAKEIAVREEVTISELLEKLLRSPLQKRHERAFADTGNPVG